MRLVNVRPDRGTALFLAILPFALVILAYVLGSAERLALNPDDKLLPSLGSLGEAIVKIAFTADARTGDYLLWTDTLASLERLFSALAISTAIALAIGVLIGMLPVVRSFLAPFVAMVSMVPPLALLPILFIVMGLGEASKIALITIGITPYLIRDLAMRVEELPREQMIKAQTLGASTWQMALRVVLPQILPRLMDALRLSLGPAFLFLIAAEAIASDSGLGYRIFLVRRYLAMDVILPYVAWITLLAVAMDFALVRARRFFFPWFGAAK
ncbi:ABC transporter permease [Xanthobacter dioxanivorans]|uniref:ABC transporter permease n=1 Tax=Xanthobacter dioxanivorans TaxID=2528964 RepID=A0A974SIP0_9HYPH|nr:ABC transporter permease [Xanthobacter dioxanivorans]QRG06384.1 ABC transporter permease [Xanthobacter dioxanivorans]